MCRPGPDHREADTLEGLRQVQNQRHSPLIFFLSSSIKSLHFHPDFSHCALSSLRYDHPWRPSPRDTFCCHFATSGDLRASHQRINVDRSAIGLSLVTFFGLVRHLPPCSTLLQELHNLSSRFFCQVQKYDGSHHVLHLFLLCTFLMPFPSHLLSTSATLLTFSSTPHSSMVCLAYSAHPRHIAQCADHSFLFASQRSNNLASSCPPALHGVGFVILCRSPALPSALLITCSTLC